MRQMQQEKIVSNSLFTLVNNYYIQDLEDKLIRSNEVTKHVFFDTSEVIDMIMGIHAFDTGMAINKELFKKESTLVHALAYEGWLGKIRLLPPHQDELYHKITSDGMRFPKKRYKEEEDRILTELLYTAGIDEIEKDLKKLETKEEVKKYIIDANATLLFKVAKLIKDTFWLDRHKYLFDDKKIININNDSYEVKELIAHPVFEEVYKLLNKERPNSYRSENNLVDALSLTLLQKKLEEYKKSKKEKKKSLVLPVYYVSSAKVYNVLKNYIQQNRKGYFYYEENDKRIPIVRDCEFFILDAIFSITGVDRGETFESHFMGYDGSINIKDDIRLVDENALLHQRVFDMDYKESFREKADNIINLNFFKKIWFENKGLEEVGSELFKYYNDAIDESKEQLEKAVEQKKKEIQKELGDRLSIIKLYRKISEDINFEDTIDEKIKFIDKNKDIFREFALTRFSFKDKTCKKIEELIKRLFNFYKKDDKYDYYKIIDIDIREKILEGIEAKIIEDEKEKHERYDEFTVTLAVLWVFEKYELITDLCSRVAIKEGNKIVDYHNYQIPIIHGCALLMTKAKRNKNVIQNIIEGLENFNSKKDNYKIRIGIAYLSFNLWYSFAEHPDLPELMNQQHQSKEMYKVYFNKAIMHLEKVVNFLARVRDEDDSDDKEYRHTKYYYALNNCIYYITKGGDDKKFSKLAPLCEVLSRCRQSSYWQNRFNDTLAWYNLRKAIIFRNANDYNSFEYHIKQADDKCQQFAPVKTKEKNIKQRLKELIEKQKLNLEIVHK